MNHTILYGQDKRYQLVADGESAKIIDNENDYNLFFVATSGFGISSDILEKAEFIVDSLNERF